LNITLDKELIKRTSKNYVDSILLSNRDWKVLDIGCGYSANDYATTICDIQDLSKHYNDRNFVKLIDENLPFTDNEFDFVVASHVIEHVKDPKKFIAELERVSKKGYIELPTKLEDNLVFENKKEHLWHMDFDDVNLELIISKKLQVFNPILTVSTVQKLREYFRKSLVIELYWENKIDYKFIEKNIVNQMSLINLVRKFFSKKIRSIFN
tara:strand:- start:591 stop:1220 length:630 start_codon:yes stop_codon:yes gene_type:complete